MALALWSEKIVIKNYCTLKNIEIKTDFFTLSQCFPTFICQRAPGHSVTKFTFVIYKLREKNCFLKYSSQK